MTGRCSMCAEGMAFIVVLWLIVAMSAVAMAVAAAARTHCYHAAAIAAGVQARTVEAGALCYVLVALGDIEGAMPDAVDLACDGMELGDGAFWIVRPHPTDDAAWAFGLVDEGGKIDLNTASQAVLEGLPNMTADVAAAIIDWRDEDETVTGGGAESDYYLRQDDAYNAKNAPFETVWELRLVAGVDDGLLYGEDTNRNGVLDAWENDGTGSDGDDDGDGRLNRGLAGLTTAYLRWPDTPEGIVDVNAAEPQQIRQALTGVLSEARAEAVAQQIQQRRPFPSLFHLHFACQLTAEEFAAIEQVVAVPSQSGFRLNVNAAGAGALAALGGLEEADVETLLAARDAAGDVGSSLAWMLDALSQDKLLALAAAGITGRSWQYTADIVAVAAGGRAFRHVRYAIDVSNGTPRVIHRLDLTACGWPLDPDILDRLRAGDALEEVLNLTRE
ncbi:MAG: general secretion pathway protein GspK [Planctomycetes bacterium]|nr:general secretion pathway protein GspK [Planctomycetota bacterium]